MSDRITPPYRIETARTIVRCYQPTDAALLRQSLKESLDHLRPWLPWVKDEPESLEQKVQRLRQFRGKFDLNEEYVYGIFSPDESQLIGGTGLHDRIGPNALEIGYWIHRSHVNQGITTEVSAALVKVAFEICKLDRVEIRCDPKNLASARVPEKLGFTHEATLRDRLTNVEGEPCATMIWSLFADDFANSPCAESELRAYDALGNQY